MAILFHPEETLRAESDGKGRGLYVREGEGRPGSLPSKAPGSDIAEPMELEPRQGRAGSP